MEWPQFRSLTVPRMAADLALCAVGAVLHVALWTVEKAAFQFDPRREYR